MKKMIQKLTLAVMATLLSVSVYANTTSLTSTQVENLKQIGFSDQDIAEIPESKLELYKDINPVAISEDNSYTKVTYEIPDYSDYRERLFEGNQEIKVDMEEVTLEEMEEMIAEQEISTLGVVGSSEKTSFLTLTTKVYSTGDPSRFLVTTDFNWDCGVPYFFNQDMIATTTSDDLVMVQDSEVARLYIDYGVTGTGTYVGTVTKLYSEADSIESNGAGCAFGLDLGIRQNTNYYTNIPRGFMNYMTELKNPKYTGPLSAGAAYGHKTMAGSISINWGAPSFSPTSRVKNATPTYLTWRP